MNQMENATTILSQAIGQNKIMALATRNGEGVAVRTVNVYTYDDCFYFVTEWNSNKFSQLTINDHAALSVDAIQISGHAVPLEHPGDETNKEVVNHIESQLPQQFNQYKSESDKRLVKVTPANASFIMLDTGAGYVIDYDKKEAIQIHR